MERHVYTIPVNEFDQYKRRLNLPDNASLTFWYENRRTKTQNQQRKKRKSIKDSPAYGMWASREDMRDPSAYVQTLRKSRSFD